MLKRLARVLFAVLLVCAAARPAMALEDGIYDQARTGCGCHGGTVPPPNTTTRPLILGLPLVEGYVPGQTYELTLLVVGVTVPLGDNARAGFNLQTTGGALEKLDDTISTRVWGECDLMNAVTGCAATATCGVKTTGESPDPTCRDAVACFFRRCSTPGQGTCRDCRAEIIDAQATHTSGGNDHQMWKISWHAPSPGVGEVTFFMAGNYVDGDGVNSLLDFWSIAPGIVVPQAR